MREPDSFDALLREQWKSPSPTEELDQRMISAYRRHMRYRRFSTDTWRKVWRMKVSVPVPLLAATAVTMAGLFFWLHSTTPLPASSETSRTVIQSRAGEFQPLPNGEARVVLVTEFRKGSRSPK